mmetsp:Transcript_38276/g.95203  ORF Transcript_38276/g.95203 Transcript_38276/m.95203 type:complete len:232 (+) Transcript_38276:2997-3692(+)
MGAEQRDVRLRAVEEERVCLLGEAVRRRVEEAEDRRRDGGGAGVCGGVELEEEELERRGDEGRADGLLERADDVLREDRHAPRGDARDELWRGSEGHVRQPCLERGAHAADGGDQMLRRPRGGVVFLKLLAAQRQHVAADGELDESDCRHLHGRGGGDRVPRRRLGAAREEAPPLRRGGGGLAAEAGGGGGEELLVREEAHAQQRVDRGLLLVRRLLRQHEGHLLPECIPQ